MAVLRCVAAKRPPVRSLLIVNESQAMSGGRRSRVIDGQREYFLGERLGQLVQGLPVRDVAIAQIEGFDQDCWLPAGRRLVDRSLSTLDGSCRLT